MKPEKTRFVQRASVLRGSGDRMPVQLDYVQFSGIRRTQNDALVKEITEMFRSQTLKDLVKNCDLAAAHLMHVGLFKRVEPIIDVSDRNPNNFAVEFLIREPRPFSMGASAGLTNQGEANASFNFDKESVFGRGESFTSSYTYGVRGSNMFNIGAVKPFLGWQRYTNLGTYVYRTFAAHPWAHFDGTDTGMVGELNWRSFGSKLRQSLKYTASWRQLETEKGASFAVREHAGHTFKSSVEHAIAYDTRDSVNLPSKGLLGRLVNEYAGLFGDVGFLRSQVDFQAATQLARDLILSLNANVMYVTPMRGRTLHLLDRAYLGGPLNLRGFGQNSIGPCSDGCFIGGMASFSTAAHGYYRLWPRDTVFGHIFATLGSVHAVQHGAVSTQVLRRLTDDCRLSVGAGVAVKVGDMFRLELNYVLPLWYLPTDRTVHGIQFGVGVSFL